MNDLQSLDKSINIREELCSGCKKDERICLLKRKDYKAVVKAYRTYLHLNHKKYKKLLDMGECSGFTPC